MAHNFTIANAVTHVFKAPQADGFLLKFALVYALVGVVFYGASLWINAPLYAAYVEVFSGGASSDPVELNRQMTEINQQFRMRLALSYLISLPGGLAFWACFDAAGQRRYMRGEPFALRIGTDEFMLLGVGVLYWLCVMGAYLGGAIVAVIIGFALYGVAGSGGGGAAAIVPLIAILAMLFAILWIGIRLSPAAAMTIRDGDFRFGKAWRLTKGKFWPLLGANLVLWVVFGLMFLAAYFGFLLWGYTALQNAAGGGELDYETVMRAASQPSFWVLGSVLMTLLLGLQGFVMHVFQGPPALLALNDLEIPLANIGDHFD